MKQLIALILATFALEAGVIAVGSGQVHAETRKQFTACKYEDGGNVPCYWDGPNRTNGKGFSYLIFSNGDLVYLSKIKVYSTTIVVKTKKGTVRSYARVVR